MQHSMFHNSSSLSSQTLKQSALPPQECSSFPWYRLLEAVSQYSQTDACWSFSTKQSPTPVSSMSHSWILYISTSSKWKTETDAQGLMLRLGSIPSVQHLQKKSRSSSEGCLLVLETTTRWQWSGFTKKAQRGVWVSLWTTSSSYQLHFRWKRSQLTNFSEILVPFFSLYVPGSHFLLNNVASLFSLSAGYGLGCYLRSQSLTPHWLE